MHEQFLLAALDQAKLGRGLCAPNPAVGAVAVQNGTIIAQAWHPGAGSLHAEQLLIAQFPAATPGVSLYVSLEPCNHWGKTPPCTEAIIQHGIEKVIYGYVDPNPVVAKNNTPNRLALQGIDCLYLPLPEIEAFYKSYRYWTQTGRPRVTVKIAQTLDGKIAGVAGERLHLSNEKCKQFTHELRANADVILTSARTIQRDDPLLNVRLAHESQSKHLAILDKDLRLTDAFQAIHHSKQCHIFYSDALDPPEPQSRIHYHPVALNKGLIDLNQVIHHLGRLGYHDVFVEAGGKVFSALHKEGLVHRTYIYIVPAVLKAEATSAYPVDEIFAEPLRVSWQGMGDNMILCLDWPEE